MKKKIGIAGGISAACLVAVMAFEGFRGDAYKDAVGVPTIGYGHTKGVRMGDTITQSDAQKLLSQELSDFWAKIQPSIKVEISQNEADAFTSFAYNVGVGAFKSSTMLKKLNRGDHKGACNQLSKWVYAGGRKLPGLVKRRDVERRMCLGEAVTAEEVKDLLKK